MKYQHAVPRPANSHPLDRGLAMLGAENNQSRVVDVCRFHGGDQVAEIGVEVTNGLDEVGGWNTVVVITRALLRDREGLEVSSVDRGGTTSLGPDRTVEVVAHGPVLESRPMEIVVAFDFGLCTECIDFGKVSLREPKARRSVGDSIGGVLVRAVVGSSAQEP
jgi:hypothetical protein